MFYRFLSGEIDTLRRIAPFLILFVLAYGYLCVVFDLPGFLTIVQFGALSVSATMLSDYRRERGLWMHASLYLVIYVAVYALFMISEIYDVIRGVAAPVLLGIDGTLATAVLGIHIRFLSSAISKNYQWFKD